MPTKKQTKTAKKQPERVIYDGATGKPESDYDRGYRNGFSDGAGARRRVESAAIYFKDALDALHASSTNGENPKLRLVSDGEQWGVEQSQKIYGGHYGGLFCSWHETSEVKWLRLCNSKNPLIFTSRDAAKAWVKREFGEAGIRSLKENAEFRPA